MVLAERKIEFAFEAGMDQSIDKRILPAGLLRRAVNLYWDRGARLRKRPGFDALTLTDTAGAAITDVPRAVAELGDEKVLICEKNIYTKSEETQKWATRGSHPGACDIQSKAIRRYPDAGCRHFSFDVSTGYLVCAWIKTDDPSISALDITGDLVVAVYDNVSGALLWESTIVTAGSTTTGASYPRVVATGTKVHVFYVDIPGTGTNTLYSYVFDTASPTAMGAQKNYGVVDATSLTWGRTAYDIDVYQEQIYLVKTNSGGANFDVRTYDADLNLINSTTITDDADYAVAISVSSSRVWVAFSDSGTTTTDYYTRNLDLTAATGPYTIEAAARGGLGILAHPTVATSCIVVYQVTASSGGITYYGFAPWLVTSVGGTTFYMTGWHYSPASKPFVQNGKVYCFAYFHSTEYQQHYMLAEVNMNSAYGTLLPDAWFAYGEADQDKAWSPFLQRVIADGTTWRAALEHEFSRAFSTEVLQEARIYDLTWSDASRRLLRASAHGAPVFSGCMLWGYDGAHAHEIGFPYAPDRDYCSITDSATAGSLVAETTYQWCFVFEWYDRLGRRHLSSPSVPIQHTTGTGKTSVDVKVQTLSCTRRYNRDPDTGAEYGQKLRILIYRTSANGTVFRLVSSSALRPLVNDVTTHSMTLHDGIADATLEDGNHELLYTTGGNQPNTFPGSCSHVVEHRQRLFVCSGNKIRYSKTLQEGIAPEFTDANEFTVGTGEKLVGLGSMDGMLFAFTGEKVYVIAGDGPNDLGFGGFAAPEELPVDAGCADARSILTFRDGLAYYSGTSLELIPRGGGPPVPFGDAISDELEAYPTVTSAVVVPEWNQARFTLSDGSGEGVTACFDLTARKFTLYSIDGNRDHVAAGMWGDTYVGIQSVAAGSRVSVEGVGFADRGSAWITSEWETGDIRVAGLNGVQRIWKTQWMGEFLAAARVNVYVAYDGEPTYSLHGSWNIYGKSAGAELAEEYRNRRQTTNAVRYKFTDSIATLPPNQVAAPSEGVVISAFTLSAGVQSNTRRSPTNTRTM